MKINQEPWMSEAGNCPVVSYIPVRTAQTVPASWIIAWLFCWLVYSVARLSWAKAKPLVKAEFTESAAVLETSQDSPTFSSRRAYPKPIWHNLDQNFQHNGMKPHKQ